MIPADVDRSEWKRLKQNAPGDFYGDGSCLQCGVPEAEAPELLAALSEHNSETYFARQPETRDEIERACKAVLACCTDSLRYGGTDPVIIRRLGNRPETCDLLLPGGPVRQLEETDEMWAKFLGRRGCMSA